MAVFLNEKSEKRVKKSKKKKSQKEKKVRDSNRKQAKVIGTSFNIALPSINILLTLWLKAFCHTLTVECKRPKKAKSKKRKKQKAANSINVQRNTLCYHHKYVSSIKINVRSYLSVSRLLIEKAKK